MVRWGVIGAGHMANIFAHSIQEVNNAKLVAISSKDNKNLEFFGDRFKIEKKFRFSNYEEICKINEVDAIYISSLNNTHFDLIKLVAMNNKNILCEKPFCLNLYEAVEIQKILKKYKVSFFEAIAYLSHPQTNHIFNLINNDKLIDFGFLTGDIVKTSTEKNWNEIDSDLKLLNCPVYFAVGNHDIDNLELYKSRRTEEIKFHSQRFSNPKFSLLEKCKHHFSPLIKTLSMSELLISFDNSS